MAGKSDEVLEARARHNVRLYYIGSKTFNHPAVGELTLAFEAVDLPTDDLRA